MTTFANDSSVLALQHKLAAAKANTRASEDEGQPEDIILYCMEVEDEIIRQLLAMGCSIRDCQ